MVSVCVSICHDDIEQIITSVTHYGLKRFSEALRLETFFLFFFREMKFQFSLIVDHSYLLRSQSV